MSSICYPIEEYIVQTNPCKTEWKSIGRIGEDSAYGEVWKTCCESKCNYVLKFLKFGKGERSEFGYEQVTKEVIEKEVKLQNDCSKLSLCPKVLDSWFCKNGGAIVMGALHLPVRKLIMQYTDIGVRLIILGTILGMIQKLHLNNIYHGDTHLNNIMVHFDQNADIEEDMTEKEKYKEYNYRYLFIDMGRSGYISEAEDKKDVIREDYVKLTTDINNLYDNNTSDSGLKLILEFLESFLKNFN